MTNTMNQTDGAGSKRLHRSVDGRMLGGVAAGLATYFAFEVTHVRIAFVVLSILGGAGIPLYLAAWALIPEDGSDVAIADGLLPPRRRCRRRERLPWCKQPVPVLRRSSPLAARKERHESEPVAAGGPSAEKRRRARLVLWAAGVVALLGLVGGRHRLVPPDLIAERL